MLPEKLNRYIVTFCANHNNPNMPSNCHQYDVRARDKTSAAFMAGVSAMRYGEVKDMSCFSVISVRQMDV